MKMLWMLVWEVFPIVLFLGLLAFVFFLVIRQNSRDLLEIEGLIAEICMAPRRFRRIDGDVQRHLANDFPYALLYLDETESVWIVAVMPLSRDPDYWKHRLTA